jgi:hypothetical protein
MSTPPPLPLPESTLDAALVYVRRGLAVIPLHTVRYIAGQWMCTCNRRPCPDKAGKHPQQGYGLNHACTNENQARHAWEWIPDGNIGIVVPAGCFVAELDGTEGIGWWDARGGDTVTTRTTISGSGTGEHRWYRLPDGESVRNGQLVSFGDHREVKLISAGKGYLVAPPSRHESGGQYIWKHDQNAVEIPGQLLTEVRATSPSPNGASPKPNGQDWFATAATMGVDSGRGTFLTSYTGKLISIGMDPDVIEAQALKLNSGFGTPHSEAEALKIIRGCIGRYKPGTEIETAVQRTDFEARFDAKAAEQRARVAEVEGRPLRLEVVEFKGMPINWYLVFPADPVTAARRRPHRARTA